MILCADIGGTHARLALAEPGTTDPVAERYFLCNDYPGFEPLLAEYLAETGARIATGCLAVAGPVSDDGRRARLTNLPWALDANALAVRFGIGRLALANDFAAAAMGVTVAPAETLIPLQTGEPLPEAPRLVVGAGTGLGMAILVRQGGRWRVLPGEGGHVGFAPLDEAQDKVWRALRAEHGRVTAERIVSGPGLADIHRILVGKELSPATITQQALIDGDPAARQSLDVFLAAYGAFAGDMAMVAMARGGVFLAGGIAGKLLSILPDSPFLPTFNAKAEHAEIARRMPVTVAIDPALGLRGAACLADNSLATN
jgi:glucokinase